MFGAGLVRTIEDFGMRGDDPSHPELLDWLATEMMGSGWDTKHLVRMIVTSAAYRQTSTTSVDLLSKDPGNALLERGPRVRLPAEVIRDQALYVSGLLEERLGGPSALPFQPAGLWEELNGREGFSTPYRPDRGPDRHRRSLYTFWKRTLPPPSMAIFDAPSRETATPRRFPTNTPLQALVLLNDPEWLEASRNLAERMIARGGNDPSGWISYGFRATTGRVPSADELALLVSAYQEQLTEFGQNPKAALQLLSVGDSPRDGTIGLARHGALTLVARALLNLSETITKE
jgi:hypothetical protein